MKEPRITESYYRTASQDAPSNRGGGYFRLRHRQVVLRFLRAVIYSLVIGTPMYGRREQTPPDSRH